MFEECKRLFTYENITDQKNTILELNGYMSRINDKSIYVDFSYVGEDKSRLPPKSVKNMLTGWKLHIALSSQPEDNIAKAWDILKDIVIEEGITQVKIVRPESQKELERDADQQGKQVTAYMYLNPDKEWGRILNTMEKELRENDIIPGAISSLDKTIDGSSYFSYRNDEEKRVKDFHNTKSLRPRKAEEVNPESPHNPYGKPDPLNNVRINCNKRDSMTMLK